MTEFRLPSENELQATLLELSGRVEPIERCILALKTGKFVHPDGRIDELRLERISLGQAALLSYLSRQCRLDLSVEVGFGMGSSAAIILGTRSALDQRFEHVIFDPYGLPDGRGGVVQSYLSTQFGSGFRRITKPSEIGLAQLLDERGPGSAGLIYIDGGHHFDNVMVDFVLADRLCCDDGYIIFDDALFPAIETVLNYVRSNRPDYLMSHLPVANTSVIRKVGPDCRHWSAFKPFAVPNRCDWEPAGK